MKIERRAVLPRSGVLWTRPLHLAMDDRQKCWRVIASQDRCLIFLGLCLLPRAKATNAAKYTQQHFTEDRVNKVRQMIQPWVECYE